MSVLDDIVATDEHDWCPLFYMADATEDHVFTADQWANPQDGGHALSEYALLAGRSDDVLIIDEIQSLDGNQKIQFTETTNKISFTAGGVLMARMAAANIAATVASGSISFIALTSDDNDAMFRILNSVNQWRMVCKATSGNYQFIDQTGGTIPIQIVPETESNALYLKPEQLFGVYDNDPKTILDVMTTSPTDPIADAWDTHCLRESKSILCEVTDFDPVIEQFKTIPQPLWTRKAILSDDKKVKKVRKEITAEEALEPQEREIIDKTKTKDIYAITDDGKVKKFKTTGTARKTVMAPKDDVDFDEETGKFYKPFEEPLTDAEIAAKEVLLAKRPKFTEPRYGPIAEEVPKFCQAFGKDGDLIGVDLAAIIGLQGAVIRGLIHRVEALEGK